jgi:cysteine-rich repeat protein
MLRRAAWFGIAFLVAACSQTGLDPGDDSGVRTGSGGAWVAGAAGSGGAHDGGSFDLGDAPFCGNGTLDTAQGETCDDGNQFPGDGCDVFCRTECNWACGSCGPTGVCIPAVCGDGRVDALEQCDDGNSAAGDGCSQCQIEQGWFCPVAGRPCVPICGDGMKKGTETCDDQNAVDGDGCSSDCLVEPTGAHCGDGIIQGAEACDPPTGIAFTGLPCTASCRYEHYCGDANLDPGEECDLGLKYNVGGYGDKGCTPACKHTHYCGDSMLDAGEACDEGQANGTLGICGCSSLCQINLC